MSIELALFHLKLIYLMITQLNEQKESDAFIVSFSEKVVPVKFFWVLRSECNNFTELGEI